jgi:hypothetical protein
MVSDSFTRFWLWGAIIALFISNMVAARAIADPQKQKRAKHVASYIVLFFFIGIIVRNTLT